MNEMNMISDTPKSVPITAPAITPPEGDLAVSDDRETAELMFCVAVLMSLVVVSMRAAVDEEPLSVV